MEIHTLNTEQTRRNAQRASEEFNREANKLTQEEIENAGDWNTTIGVILGLFVLAEMFTILSFLVK